MRRLLELIQKHNGMIVVLNGRFVAAFGSCYVSFVIDKQMTPEDLEVEFLLPAVAAMEKSIAEDPTWGEDFSLIRATQTIESLFKIAGI